MGVKERRAFNRALNQTITLSIFSKKLATGDYYE